MNDDHLIKVKRVSLVMFDNLAPSTEWSVSPLRQGSSGRLGYRVLIEGLLGIFRNFRNLDKNYLSSGFTEPNRSGLEQGVKNYRAEGFKNLLGN